MKEYIVGYKNWNENVEIKVIARSINKALEVAEQHLKKNYGSSKIIQYVSYQHEVTAVQK